MNKRRPTVHFTTTEFKKLHGFQPRGIALWTFYFVDEPNTAWRASTKPLTYTDAKHMATIEATRRGVTSVYLDPNPQEWTRYEHDK